MEILKVLVGSQAHGLAKGDSDFDYRGVFVAPTKDFFEIGGRVLSTNWIEGKEDNTSWELGHFLTMAVKCNPTILEVFKSPVINQTPIGKELISLFPYVWNSQDVMNAFIGYGLNQRKKFLEDKDGKPNKFAAAYARTLYNAWELLTTGDFTVRIADVPYGQIVKNFKEGNYSYGEVIDVCRRWEEEVKIAYQCNPDKQTNLEPINEFIIKVRKQNI